MKCKICTTENKKIFSSKILNKYDIEYFHCLNCGFLQTEEAYWIEEAYKESINVSDTGILARNLYLSDITSIIIYFFFDKDKKFLDFAGGYGLLTRLMRDIGFDFYWNDKYSTNLVSRGFENTQNNKIELLTSFETFEHFDNPIIEIENMLKISENILFSTDLISDNPPQPGDWWYYGLEHGQHISFYNKQTLEFIAEKYHLNLYTNGQNLHLFTKKNIDNYCFQRLLQNNNRRQLLSFLKGSFKNKMHFNKCFRTILKYRTNKDLIAFIKSSMMSKTMDDMYLVINKMDKK